MEVATNGASKGSASLTPWAGRSRSPAAGKPPDLLHTTERARQQKSWLPEAIDDFQWATPDRMKKAAQSATYQMDYMRSGLFQWSREPPRENRPTSWEARQPRDTHSG